MTFSRQLEEVKTLRENGKEKEALDLVENILSSLRNNQRIKRIICLNERSECMLYLGNSTEAEKTARNALSMAEQSPVDLQGKAKAYLNLGSAFAMQMNWEEAKKYRHQSLALWEQLNNPKELANCLFRLGQLYIYINEMDHAEKYHQRSLVLREQINSPKEIIESLRQLAIVYLDMGDVDLAIEYSQRSLRLVEESNNLTEKAEVYNVLGASYYFQGNLKLAEKYTQQALSIFEQNYVLHSNCLAFSTLGMVYAKRGKLNRAKSYFHQSLTAAEQDKWEWGKSWVLGQLAEILRLEGDLNQAEEYFQQQFAITERLENQWLMAMAYIGLARVNWGKGELGIATQYLQQSLAFLEQNKNPITIAETQYWLVNILVAQGSQQEIIPLVEQLAHFSQTTKLPYIKTQYQLAKGLLKLEQRELGSALELGSKAKMHAAQISDSNLMIHAIQFLLKVHLQLYQLTQLEKHKDQIEHLLLELEQICAQEHFLNVYLETLLVQGILQRLENNFLGAIAQFEKAKHLAEESGFKSLAQRAHDLMTQLNQQLATLQKLYEISPQMYKQAQIQEMSNYMDQVKIFLQHEIFTEKPSRS